MVRLAQAAIRRAWIGLGLFVLVAAAGSASASSLAITFDDLPLHGPAPGAESRLEIANKIISALRAERVPGVYGFVNGADLMLDPASRSVLSAWREAGFPLASHTWSHMNLNERPPADFERDVIENEPLLEAHMRGQNWRWLRFPYLAEGDTARKRSNTRMFLRSRGYRIGAVTMSFDDFAFNEPYARCVAVNDWASITRLKSEYLKAAAQAVSYYRDMSNKAFGREIPYVLLMHIGAFDAEMLPTLLAQYRSEGFAFVTLEKVQSDPFYRPDMDLSDPAGPVTLENAMATHGIPVPQRETSLNWLDNICR